MTPDPPREHARSPHGSTGREPPRGELPPEVVIAARTIDREVWGEVYRPGQGPMHHAGGPFWRSELLRRADQWERLAKSARICAEALPRA